MARQFAKVYIHVATVEWRLEVTIRHVLYNMQCAEQIIKTKEGKKHERARPPAERVCVGRDQHVSSAETEEQH